MRFVQPLTWFLIIGGIIVCGALAVKLWREGNSPSQIVSAVGDVASFFGLIIAILQIKSVKEITEATQRAISETKAHLITNLSISDLSKAIKLIEQIQLYLGHRNYELADVRLQDLRIILLQFGGNAVFLNYVGREDYDSLMKNIGIHRINLHDAIFKQKIINTTVINRTLENAINILVAVETELKFGGGGRSD